MINTLNKIIKLFVFGIVFMASNSYGAETACNNNNGSGWVINDLGTTELFIDFDFVDVAIISNVQVTVDIIHTWIGDLTVKVNSPLLTPGAEVLLFERPGTNAADTAALVPPQDSGPYGCGGDNIDVIFDDTGLTNFNTTCPPTAGASYQPESGALSSYAGENPAGGWYFYLSDSAIQDTGTLVEACITADFTAGVAFDHWVSNTEFCGDSLDTLTIAPGSDVWYCFVASNPATDNFFIANGDADGGAYDLTGLEQPAVTTYGPAHVETVGHGPFVAGTDIADGTTNTAHITATFPTLGNITLTTPDKSTTVNVKNPNFTTSTKTVTGLSQAGATLEYTITINESAGVYTPNVKVTDIVDANLGSITFTTLPTGATNNTSGNNIDISGITLPANGTETIVFTAVIGGAVSPGTNINNTARIEHTGSGVTYDAAAATVVVTSNPPAMGTKRVYFNNLASAPGDLTRDPTDALTETFTGNIDGNGNTYTLEQGIPFASAFTIDAGTHTVQLRILRTRNNPTPVDVELFNSSNLGTPIGTGNGNVISNRNTWGTLRIDLDVINPADFVAGEKLVLVITNNSGRNNRRINIRSLEDIGGGTIIKSQLELDTHTVINVDSIDVFANPWNDMTKYSSYTQTSTVSIRATISDPFGSDDITGATINIDSPTSNQVPNGVMTFVDTPTPATRVFEYIYDISGNPEEGFWPLSVTANEGYEAEVSHTDTATMIVGIPTINVSKNPAVLSDPVNASNPKAIPRSIVEYTIDVENSGFGYVDSGTTIITDTLDTNTTYYFGSPLDPATFVDGTPSSGLTFTFIDLASTIDDIDFSNDGGATYVTPTVDANGFDTTSPPINYIRINPKGEFTGSDGTNNPSMQINFRVRVE